MRCLAEAAVVVELQRLPRGPARRGSRIGVAGGVEGRRRHVVAADVVGVGIAAVLVIGRHHVRAEAADLADQGFDRDLQRLQREAPLRQRRQRIAFGQTGIDEAEPVVVDARGSPAPRAISSRRTWARSRRTAGSSLSLGLRMSPRSPPVQETTSTSAPASTYFAIVAAPLLDSSSGCACTHIRRMPGDGCAIRRGRPCRRRRASEPGDEHGGGQGPDPHDRPGRDRHGGSLREGWFVYAVTRSVRLGG
jgi:hypothetical protein